MLYNDDVKIYIRSHFLKTYTICCESWNYYRKMYVEIIDYMRCKQDLCMYTIFVYLCFFKQLIVLKHMVKGLNYVLIFLTIVIPTNDDYIKFLLHI